MAATTKEIAEGIRRGSLYAYSPDMSWKQAGFIAPLNLDRLEYAVCQESVRMEDYYIIEYVYNMCFVTPEILFYRVKAGAGRGEEGCAAIGAAGLLEQLAPFGKRLERLASLGLFFCYEVRRSGNGRVTRIYYCSMEGFRAFTNRLGRRLSYNRTLIYKPISEVFRHLAANMALGVLQNHPFCAKNWAYEKFEFRAEAGRKPVQEELFGRLMLQRKEGTKKVYLLIEPVFFKNSVRDTAFEEQEGEFAARIRSVQEMANEFEGMEGAEGCVLFLVEDADGLANLQEVIGRFDLDFFTKRCYYSSENVIAESVRNGGDGTDALLGMSASTGKMLFRKRDIMVRLRN